MFSMRTLGNGGNPFFAPCYDPLTAAFLISGAASAGGSVLGGIADNKAGKFEAEGLQRAATEERAAAQREAFEKTREANLVMSRQIAVAAASGGGVVNPTVMDLYGDVAARGQYLAETERYKGESRARGLIDQAKAARFKGKNALIGSILEGVGEVASSVGNYKLARAKKGGFRIPDARYLDDYG